MTDTILRQVAPAWVSDDVAHSTAIVATLINGAVGQNLADRIIDDPHQHTWVMAHLVRLGVMVQASIQCEPRIPYGAPLNFVP